MAAAKSALLLKNGYTRVKGHSCGDENNDIAFEEKTYSQKTKTKAVLQKVSEWSFPLIIIHIIDIHIHTKLYVDFEAQDSLLPTNVWAATLRCPSVPLRVREERGVSKVSGRPWLKTLTEYYPNTLKRELRGMWEGLNGENTFFFG